MDLEALKRQEVIERIAFERGRRAALAGDIPWWAEHGISDNMEYVERDLSDLLEGIEEEWSAKTAVATSFMHGVAYGKREIEEED
jgi:hypothetical protein